MNLNHMFKSWILPALIIAGCFILLPPAFDSWFGPVLGPTLGTSTGYVLSFMIAIIAFWITKKVDKAT